MNFDCTKGVEMSKPLNLKIGDVIAYGISPKLRLLLPLNYPASHIVHRIVNITVVKENSCKRNICFERQTKYYTTKGDNNQYNDPYPVPSFAVVWLAKDKIDP